VEEIAYRMVYIDAEQLERLAGDMFKNDWAVFAGSAEGVKRVQQYLVSCTRLPPSDKCKAYIRQTILKEIA